ncbi:hypothetical protein U9M48_022941 [Paspalum notatum var. saurae]
MFLGAAYLQHSVIPVGRLRSFVGDSPNFGGVIRLLVSHIAVSRDDTAPSPNGRSTPASSSSLSCSRSFAQSSRSDSSASALCSATVSVASLDPLALTITVEHAVAVQVVKGEEQLREPSADPLAIASRTRTEAGRGTVAIHEISTFSGIQVLVTAHPCMSIRVLLSRTPYRSALNGTARRLNYIIACLEASDLVVAFLAENDVMNKFAPESQIL